MDEKAYVSGVSRYRPRAKSVLDASELDVAKIRKGAGKAGRSQDAFATALGVSPMTLRNWEQRRRSPTGAARVLLSLMQRDPAAIFAIMGGRKPAE